MNPFSPHSHSPERMAAPQQYRKRCFHIVVCGRPQEFRRKLHVVTSGESPALVRPQGASANCSRDCETEGDRSRLNSDVFFLVIGLAPRFYRSGKASVALGRRGGRYITARPNIGSARCPGAPDRHIGSRRRWLLAAAPAFSGSLRLLGDGLSQLDGHDSGCSRMDELTSPRLRSRLSGCGRSPPNIDAAVHGIAIDLG